MLSLYSRCRPVVPPTLITPLLLRRTAYDGCRQGRWCANQSEGTRNSDIPVGWRKERIRGGHKARLESVQGRETRFRPCDRGRVERLSTISCLNGGPSLSESHLLASIFPLNPQYSQCGGVPKAGDAPDFVEVGEAGIAVDHAMRRRRAVQRSW